MLFIGSRGKNGILAPEMVAVLFFLTLERYCILSLIPPLSNTSLFLCLCYQISHFPLRRRQGIGVSLNFSESDKMAALSQFLKATTPAPALCLVSVTIFFQIVSNCCFSSMLNAIFNVFNVT